MDCFVATLLAMTACGRHSFTSGQRDESSDWNASLPGMVARSLSSSQRPDAFHGSLPATGRVACGIGFVAAIMPEGIGSGKARKNMPARVFSAKRNATFYENITSRENITSCTLPR
jgi:hypothetical protein